MVAGPPWDGLDKIIHVRARLGIVASLAARGAMSFGDLKETLEMSDGNLSVHVRTLEEAGYLEVTKEFVRRRPRTTMRLTTRGEQAFRDYVDCLESIVSPNNKR